MPLREVTGPGGPVVDRSEAKLHMRLDGDDENASIDRYIRAATNDCETFIGRPLATRRYEYTLDGFPYILRLPRPPLRRVVSVEYADFQDVLQTLDREFYDVVGEGSSEESVAGAEIEPSWAHTWPVPRYERDAVRVTFDAGWATPCTVDPASGTFATNGGHPYVDGDTLRLQLSGGADMAWPGGLNGYSTYHVRDVQGDTLRLSAVAGGGAIDVADAGSGQLLLGQVPEQLVQGIIMQAAELYERRETAISGTIINSVPTGPVSHLWRPYCVPKF